MNGAVGLEIYQNNLDFPVFKLSIYPHVFRGFCVTGNAPRTVLTEELFEFRAQYSEPQFDQKAGSMTCPILNGKDKFKDSNYFFH